MPVRGKCQFPHPMGEMGEIGGDKIGPRTGFSILRPRSIHGIWVVMVLVNRLIVRCRYRTFQKVDL
jgi:hypothetical protein